MVIMDTEQSVGTELEELSNSVTRLGEIPMAQMQQAGSTCQV